MAGSDMVRSVLKALDLLRRVAAAPDGLRLSDIETDCGLKKTTAHNLARTLCARGFLEKDAANRMVLGPSMYELATLRNDRQRLLAARRLLRRLQRDYPSATLTFSEMTPSAIVCRLRMSPDRPGELQHPLDHRFAPYLTQTALCLQATAVQAAGFERNYPFSEYGAGRWRTADAFRMALQEVRRKGYAAEQREGRLAVAFPVPDHFALGFSLERPSESLLRDLCARIPGLCRELETTGRQP